MTMSDYKFQVTQKVHIHPIIKRISLLTFIIFLILFAMLFLPWQQTVKGHGKLIAYEPSQRDYIIVSTINGFVEEYSVSENQHVKKGDVLCKIADRDQNLSSRLKAQESLLGTQGVDSQAQGKLLLSQIDSLGKYYLNGLSIYESKLVQSTQKMESLKLHNEVLAKNFEVKKSQYERITSLKELGIESMKNFEQAQNEYVKTKIEREKNLIDISVEEQNYSILKDEKIKFINETQNKIKQTQEKLLQANISLSGIENSRLSIEGRMKSYESGIIRAPKEGVVIRILQNDTNKLLKEGDELIHFAPDVSQRSILLKVSDFNMPLIKENLLVRIKFYGWPALQISGWPSIKYGTFGGIVKRVEPLSHELGAYYVHIFETEEEPWPPQDVLRLGTQSTAWIRLESVPIWYQIWRYINAMPPNMPTEVESYEKSH
jgi:adhesin transport system membrane fusion protein